METITRVGRNMQMILGSISDQVAVKTGFTLRKSKVTGSKFMTALVTSSLTNPEWRYTDLVTAALNAGVGITKQGLAQRFSPASADLARCVLETAVQFVIDSQPMAMPLLKRFNGVYIRDSSTISLPHELKTLWPGGASAQGEYARVKLHVRLEVCSGQLGGPVLVAGREHDSKSPFQMEELRKGALRMGDLGFFSLDQFAVDSEQGIYWLSWYKADTCLYYAEDGQPLHLLKWLGEQMEDQSELQVQLGQKHRLPCRLIAIRVPPAEVEERRRRLREYAQKKQVALRAERLALAEWDLILTNIPQELLTISESLVLMRVRWQIELLFKRWKSLFQIDEWRSKNIWRILTELYAKLLSVVIEHWIGLIRMTRVAHPSYWKAAMVVRLFATPLALALQDFSQLVNVLTRIAEHFEHHCHVDPRRKRPSIYQLLEGPPCTTLA